MDILQIQEKHSTHSEILKQVKDWLDDQSATIIFPIANEVLFDLGKRADLIFISILSLAKKDNLYGSLILYRSLLEHTLKSLYIFSSVATNASDKIAENYQKHLFILEVLAQQMGVLEMEDLINNKEKKTEFLLFLVEKLPELEGFDKSNQQEITEATKQFQLNSIVKHLHKNIAGRHSQTNQLFAQMLPEYSYTSTFTHGGAYASKIMDKFSQLNHLHIELLRVVTISFTAACIAKENVLISYKPDKEIMNALKTLQDVRNI